MDTLVQDLRHAARCLRKSPGFTTVAVMTLALGIGANTAVFMLINALLMRPLSVREPQQLVEVATVTPYSEHGGFTIRGFEELVRQQHVFSALIGWFGDGVFNVESCAGLTRGNVWAVSGNFYADLGIQPAAGRLLRPDDGIVATTVAVLGYGFWHRVCHDDPAMVGKTIRLEGEPFTIIGIAPHGFTGFGLTFEPDVTIPMSAAPLLRSHILDSLTIDTRPWVRAIGRLKPAISLEQARAQLTAVWPAIKHATVPTAYVGAQRERFLDTRLAVQSAATGIEWFLRSRFTRPLYGMLAIAALLVLIACANVASLLLTRAIGRTHEIGIRAALGATRGDVARPAVIEAFVLSALGTTCGLGFAYVSSLALTRFILRDYVVPASLNVMPDGRVIGFAAAIALVVSVLCSVGPTWHLTRKDAMRLLGRGERVTGTRRVGRLLATVQIGLSVVLVIDTMLLIRTLEQLRSVEAGFESQDVVVAQLFPLPNGYKNLDNESYYPELMRRVRATPGVRAAGLSDLAPGSGSGWKETVSTTVASTPTNIMFYLISPGFFETLRIPQLQGRDVQWSDNAKASRVALITRSLATHLFADGLALGRRIRVGTDPKRQDLEIVGVVGDMKSDLHDPRSFVVYVPLLQEEADVARWNELVVRGVGDIGGLRAAVESLGHEYILEGRSLRQITDQGIVQERVAAWLAAFFGGLALLLVSLGLYALMSYNVLQRRHEIGIRLAVGATPQQTIRLMVKNGLEIIIVGATGGVAAAFASVRLIRSLLFGVSPFDPTAVAVGLILILAVTVLASWLPARRAARVDPMIVLRAE